MYKYELKIMGANNGFVVINNDGRYVCTSEEFAQVVGNMIKNTMLDNIMAGKLNDDVKLNFDFSDFDITETEMQSISNSTLTKREIEDALKVCGGSRKKAADILGCSPRVLIRRMKELNIE